MKTIAQQLTLSRALSRALTTTIAAAATPTLQSGSAFPVKTVTIANFEASVADLRHHVRASDFVAIDLEMTGVTSAPWRESFEFDRSDVRYLKVRDSAHKFAVVQFGVCPFRWEPSNQSFVAYPHNFYVFQREELGSLAPCLEFLCQTTSMDFLAKYKFDFNACIKDWISWIGLIVAYAKGGDTKSALPLEVCGVLFSELHIFTGTLMLLKLLLGICLSLNLITWGTIYFFLACMHLLVDGMMCQG